MAEEGGQGEIGQHWKNILVVVPADKHKTIQPKHRNEWQEVGMDYRVRLSPPKTPKPLNFQEDLKEQTAHDN